MKEVSECHRLIKDLFKDKLKRPEISKLSGIDMVEQRMRKQWIGGNERVDPKIGEQICAKIQKE